MSRPDDAAALVCTETSRRQNHDKKAVTVLFLILRQRRPTLPLALRF